MTELFGLGRTWWVAILVLVSSSILFFLKALDADQWISLIKWVFAAAAGKSAVVGALNGGKK